MKISSKLYCKNLWFTIVTVVLMISAMAPLIAQAEINATGTYFWISPTTNIHQSVGGTFTIGINITNAPATYAWDLSLNFNKSILSVVRVSEGPWLSSVGTTIFVNSSLATANAQGSIAIGDTLQGSSSGASNNGALCTVQFKVLASGTSALDLVDGTTVLVSPSLVSTVYPNNDGFYAGTAVHDIGITSVVANVSSVNQGAFVGLTVTVSNQGNFTESGSVTVTAVPIDARESKVAIGTKTFASLASGGSAILPTISWNTTGVAGQAYNIVSNATLTGFTDVDLHNNVYIGPTVRVISPHDIKVSGVTILTPLVHKGKTANVSVTVYNEGQNPENVSATVLGTLPGPVTSILTSIAFPINLAAGASSTIYASWNTASDATGIYTITVNATLPASEHETDLADNIMTASGTLSVIIDDVGITGISLGAYGRWINVTVKNFGTVPAYCTVYVWAVWPNETGSFNMSWTIPTVKAPTAHALLIGEIENVYLLSNTSETFFALDPYGSSPYGVPAGTKKANLLGFTLWPPAAPYNGTPLTSGTHYAIYAVAVKLYDVDDNLANNVFKASGTMEARLPGDIQGIGSIDARDLGLLGAAYGAYWGSPAYNQQADFTNAGNVGAIDLGKLGANYGTYY